MELGLIKKRQPRKKNEIERRESVRLTKRNYQSKYRAKKKALKELEKKNFNDTYQNDNYECIKDLDFNIQSTLKFNNFTSIEYAIIAVHYLTKELNRNKVITNIAYFFEYGKGKNLHIHLAINFKETFLECYPTEKEIKVYLYNIWNNDRVQNGNVWVGKFKSELHKQNYLKYMFKEVLPLSKYHYRQKQVDLYFIQSYKEVVPVNLIEIGYNGYLNEILTEAKISPANDYNTNMDYYTEENATTPYNVWQSLKEYRYNIASVLATIVLLFI